MKTNNLRDTGSLHVGVSGGATKWEKGMKIQIAGEPAVRTISYVMGLGEKTHLCCKGTGPMPLGEVEYSLVD